MSTHPTYPTHTPGPWTLFERDRVTQYGATDEVGPFVVGVAEITIVEIQDDGEPGVARADAQLIAAAPELLAACEALLPLARAGVGPMLADSHPEEMAGHGDGLEALIDATVDAIAKARGGARSGGIR